jgi:hypothetical protein
MSDHIPDPTKMISDTPRTDAHNWKDGDYDDPLHAFYDFAGQLERELNAANAIIRQQQLLDEENLRLQDRIKRLEDIISRAKNKFFRHGSNGTAASGMLDILGEVRKP